MNIKEENKKILILPGLYNSGSKHWQSHWEKSFPTFERVNQRDWDTPRCDDWIEKLNDVILQSGDDVTLIAHSLSCVLVGKWANKYPTKINGALLVAPSDTEGESFPEGTQGFSPMPINRLPFRSILVTSTNDQLITLERAAYFADAWGSELIVMGDLGHIGSDADLGMWVDGLEQLTKLTGEIYK